MRLLLAAAVTFTLFIAMPEPAHGACDATTEAGSGDSTFDASSIQASCPQEHETTDADAGGTPAGTDAWNFVCSSEKGNQLCGGDYRTCADSTLLQEHYFYPADGNAPVFLGTNCPEDAHEPDLGPTPTDILHAFRRIPLPPSTLHVQPPDGETLVNFETNLFTTADDLDRTVTLLGHHVRFKIRATTFTWHYGDTDTTTTHTPGAAYPDLENTHRYRTQATVHPSVDTTWAADYQIDDGPWDAVNGTVTITGTRQTLTIRTATPHLVGDED
jgi:hypothetical protein